MASLTTDEPSSFPLIAQETGQVHTVNLPPKSLQIGPGFSDCIMPATAPLRS